MYKRQAAEYGVEGVTTIGNTSSAGVDFDGTVYTVDGALTVTATSSGEAITFSGGGATTVLTKADATQFNNGVINLAASTPLTVRSDGGAITINSIMGAASGDNDVTINANDDYDGDNDGETIATETITLGAVGSGDEIGKLTLDAADGITLTGNITLANAALADLDINSKVFISGDVTIDTDNATHDGLVDFASTIDGVNGGADDDLVIPLEIRHKAVS